MFPSAPSDIFSEPSSDLGNSIFNQRSDTIKAMDGVQLLMSDAVPLLDSLSLLKSEVALVRHRIESYETWGVANSFRNGTIGGAPYVLVGANALGGVYTATHPHSPRWRTRRDVHLPTCIIFSTANLKNINYHT